MSSRLPVVALALVSLSLMGFGRLGCGGATDPITDPIEVVEDRCSRFTDAAECDARERCEPVYGLRADGSLVFVRCEPAPDVVCPPVCDNYCTYGRVIDAAGCATCECLPPPACEPVLCDLYCEHGWAKDAQGCDLCQCSP